MLRPGQSYRLRDADVFVVIERHAPSGRSVGHLHLTGCGTLCGADTWDTLSGRFRHSDTDSDFDIIEALETAL